MGVLALLRSVLQLSLLGKKVSAHQFLLGKGLSPAQLHIQITEIHNRDLHLVVRICICTFSSLLLRRNISVSPHLQLVPSVSGYFLRFTVIQVVNSVLPGTNGGDSPNHDDEWWE